MPHLSCTLLAGSRGRWLCGDAPVTIFHTCAHTHTEYSVPYTKVRSTSRRTPKRVASKLPLHRHHSLTSLILPLFFTLLYNTAKIHVHTLNQHKQLLVCQICYKRNDCTTGHCISLVYMCTPDEKKLSYGKRLFLKQHTDHHRAKHSPHLCVGALSHRTQSREAIVSIWHCLNSMPPLWLHHGRVHYARRAVKMVAVPFVHTAQEQFKH